MVVLSFSWSTWMQLKTWHKLKEYVYRRSSWGARNNCFVELNSFVMCTNTVSGLIENPNQPTTTATPTPTSLPTSDSKPLDSGEEEEEQLVVHLQPQPSEEDNSLSLGLWKRTVSRGQFCTISVISPKPATSTLKVYLTAWDQEILDQLWHSPCLVSQDARSHFSKRE